MEGYFYLGGKENKEGVKEYFVYLGINKNVVTPAFKDIEKLRDHLTNRGTNHGQPWSMGAVILLEENKKIPREIGFIKSYNFNYRLQYERWKAEGGKCASYSEKG